MNIFRNIIALAVLGIVALFGNVGLAANAPGTPVLTQIVPRGAQRGTEKEFTFVGARLFDAKEVFFYDDGFQVSDLTVVDSKTVEAVVQVDSDCRLGEHMVQLRTRSGISDYRIIHVEAYPAVKEDESANNIRERAQFLQPVAYSDDFPDGVGLVVDGKITNEDHDWFAIDGVKSQRLSIEIVGMRLGDFCDTVLELYGPDGKLLGSVDDTPLTKQDPVLSVLLPKDGRYQIHVTDSAGRGQKDAWYRMHVGNFPRPSMASPPAVREQAKSKVEFTGDCLGPIEQSLRVSRADLYRGGMLVKDRLGVTPTPVPLQVVDRDTQIIEEQEPNNQFRKLEQDFVPVPCSIHGMIAGSKDLDAFRLIAKKGQRIHVEAFGHRIGSATDPTIRVRRNDGRTIVTGVDSIGTDSEVTFTASADGTYFVEIENGGGVSESNTPYLLSITDAKPSFSFSIAEFQRYSQQRTQVAVPTGNRFAMLVNAQRNGFDGAFRLNGDQLPKSIRMLARPMPAGANAMPVVFEADRNVEDSGTDSLFGKLIDFTAESIPETDGQSKDSVVGQFQSRAQLMRVAPNNMCMKFGVVNKLAVAQLAPVPFKVDLVPPSVPIAQSGRMKLRVNIQRDEGFKQPITLRLPFRPPGIGANPTLRVKSDQDHIDYLINANAKAALGDWPICLTAVAPNDSGSMISTGLQSLKIVPPFVAIESDMVSAQVDSEIVVACRVDLLNEFDGSAEVLLAALPAGVSAETQTITSKDESISFPVSVAENCKTGKNHSVRIQVTVFQDNHPIVFDAGRLLMRFSPRAKKVKQVDQSVTVSNASSEDRQ